MTAPPKTRIAVWWCFPCKATSGIFRELSERADIEIDVFLLEGMSENRIKLGWEFPDYGRAKVEIAPADPGSARVFFDTVDLEHYDLHILNSLYVWPEFNRIVDRLIKERIDFGIMTEAPFNGFYGLKRLAKRLYIRCVLPMKTRARARHAKFVLSLSGAAPRALQNLRRQGYPAQVVQPFGYFLEERGKKAPLRDITGALRLLCTGYLTQNKGQHWLIEAVRRLRDRHGAHAVEVKVTGFGPAEDALRAQIQDADLGGIVELTGAVENVRLHALYDWCDLFVAPGFEEPWGIRINEALQYGIPLIVSDRIGASELVSAAQGGEVFTAGDVQDLTEKLSAVVATPARLKEWQKNIFDYRDRLHPRTASDVLCHVVRQVRDGKQPHVTPLWLWDRDSSS